MKALLVVMFLTGCSVQQSYVESDRKTYETLKPKILKWVASEPAAVGSDVKVLLNSWEVRINHASQ